MRIRCIGLLLLALSLATALGCSRGKVGPPPTLPPEPEPQQPQPTVQPNLEPEPEVEPVPGEAVRLTLPKDNGVWPWAVGKAEEPAESRPVSFYGLAQYAVTGFAVRPEANRAVVTIRAEPKKADPKKGPAQTGAFTRVALCNTATGRVQNEWRIPGQYIVLDLSPDGRGILATSAQPGRERSVLRLWVVGPDGQLKRWVWTPHSVPRDGLRVDATGKSETTSIEVRWAAFVGNDRIASASRAGQLRVYETDGLKPLATIDASMGRPAISPDGTKVAFLAGNSVALLDTVALKVIGLRWVGTLPPQPVLAFSPDGTNLAVGGNGRVIFLNLLSGQLQSVTLMKLDVNDNGTYDKPFGWAGAAHLFADGSLFDPQLPAPVWEYSGAEFVQFRGWRIWACVRTPGTSTAAIRGFTLPDGETLARITAAKSKPEAFSLQPGSGVKLDLTGVPDDRRAEAQTMLEPRVREVGFKLDPNAPATLFASVDSPGTKPTAIYSGLGSFQYTKKPAATAVGAEREGAVERGLGGRAAVRDQSPVQCDTGRFPSEDRDGRAGLPGVRDGPASVALPRPERPNDATRNHRPEHPRALVRLRSTGGLARSAMTPGGPICQAPDNSPGLSLCIRLIRNRSGDYTGAKFDAQPFPTPRTFTRDAKWTSSVVANSSNDPRSSPPPRRLSAPEPPRSARPGRSPRTQHRPTSSASPSSASTAAA